ncbi:MAG: serine/threonine protein kinase [Deltaproteobacteria bacterium]|nr:serine/threonine protein kinase [Deltaproteobacteria bacterium]
MSGGGSKDPSGGARLDATLLKPDEVGVAAELPWADTHARPAQPSHVTTEGGVGREGSELPSGFALTSELKIVRRLGVGGQGDVYEVEDRVGRRSAAKLLLASLAQDRTFVARLQREAETVRNIDHANVIRVFGLEVADDGRPFLWMEFLVGRPLDAVIREQGPLPLERAVALAVGIARGLSAVHQLGIVHRDLKPANVFVVPGPNGELPKLMDFGIAKPGQGVDATKLTATGSILGTPSYMSPEQILNPTEADARSDQYSFGIMLFQLLTGRLPFASEKVAQLLMQHVRTPAPNARTIRPEVPPALAAIALKAMAKTGEDRYPSMSELGVKLEAALSLPASRPKVLEPEASPRWAPGKGAWAPEGAPPPPPQPPPRVASGTSGPDSPAPRVERRPITIIQPEAPGHFLRNLTIVLAIGALVVGARVYLSQRTVEDEQDFDERPRPLEVRADPVLDPAPSAHVSRGRIHVESEPPGARVWIDGSESELVTPADLLEIVVGKPVALSVHLEGHRAEPERILATVPADTLLSIVKFRLVVAKSVKLTSWPPGARVLVDGRRISGLTPLELPAMSPGEQVTVVVEADGHAPETRIVRAEEDRVEVKLRAARFIEVLSTPSGAHVKIDGSSVGSTPIFALPIVGQRGYTIEVSAEGFQSARTKVGPKDDRAHFEFELKPKSTPATTSSSPRLKELEARLVELDRRLVQEKREMDVAEKAAEREARSSTHDVVRRANAENAFDTARTKYERSVAKRAEIVEEIEELRD